MIFRTLCSAIYLLLVSGYLLGQSNQIYSDTYTNELNGPGYFAPLADVLASNLTAHSFSTHKKSGFGIHIGVIGVRSLISDGQKVHAGMTEGLDESTEVQVPTIFGSPNAVLTQDDIGNVYGFPGGFALNTVTFLVPQITISTPLNTDVSFRFFAHDFGGDFGQLSMIGGGVRHSLGDYFKLDNRQHITIGYSFNHLTADSDIVSFSVHEAQLEYGYSVNNLLMPYVNVHYMRSTLDIDYTQQVVETIFSGSGNQNVRGELGFSFRLRPVLIRAGLHVLGTRGYSAIAGFTF